MTTDDIRILQTIRLKGRARPDDLAHSLGIPTDAVRSALDPLLRAGELDEAKGRVKLTADGRLRLESLMAQERCGIDRPALIVRYREFDSYNSRFKQLVTDWQLVDGTRPNDHSDAGYDRRIIQRLVDLHQPFLELVEQLGELAPLVDGFPRRFTAALDNILAGQHNWLAAPLIDSYHTVWFELHENLIVLAGLSRAEEAAAGRAE